MKRSAIVAAALALSLAGAVARAQAPAPVVAPGEAVRLETSTGVVEGILVDRLPQGYLVNKGKTTVVVPYANVRGVSRGAPAAAPGPAPAPPPPPAPGVPAPPAPPTATPQEGFGLASDPAPVAVPIPPGIQPPAPPPPPPDVPNVIPPPAVPPAALPPPVAPPARRLPPPKTERNSTALMGVGIGMVAVGAIAAVAGVGVYFAGLSEDTNVCDPAVTNGCRWITNSAREDKMLGGQVTMGVGVAVAVTGIALWNVGGKQVPIEEKATEKKSDQPPATQGFLSIGPGSVALTGTF